MIQERDSELGAPRWDCIVNAVTNSRRTLLVISEGYLKDFVKPDFDTELIDITWNRLEVKQY